MQIDMLIVELALGLIFLMESHLGLIMYLVWYLIITPSMVLIMETMWFHCCNNNLNNIM